MKKSQQQAQLKGDSVSKIATHLQNTAADLKSTAKKWKNADGEEKEKLRARLVKTN